MKKILLFFILLISVIASWSQNYQKISTPYQYRYFRVDSTFRVPYGPTPSLRETGHITEPGALFFRTTDSTLLIWTGYTWVTAAPGGGSGGSGIGEVIAGYGLTQIDDSTLSFSTTLRDSITGLITLKLNISDTAAMLLPYLRDGDTSAMLLNYVRNSRSITINGTTQDLSADRTFNIGTITGTSATGTKLGHDFTITNDSLKMLPYVNIEDYGAVGDDATNNSAAINAAKATGKNVFIPPGIFRVTTTITLLPGQTMWGNGWNSIIKCIANTRAVQLDSNSHVRGIHFYGNGKAGSGTFNTGVFAFDAVGWSVEDCMFEEFAGNPTQNGGGGVYVAVLSNGNTDGGRVTNNYFKNNDGGLVFASRGEYVTATGNTFGGNTVAVLMGAGNLAINNNTIHNNDYGIKMISGTNPFHSTVNNNLINHNLIPYWIEDCTHELGMSFNGNMVYYGYIHIVNSSNVKFTNEHWSILDSIVLDNSYYITKVNCWQGLKSGETGYRIPTVKLNGAEDFTILGETRIAADSLGVWMRQIHNDSIFLNGPMYHTGITPASVSASDSVWVERETDGRWVKRAQSDIGGFTIAGTPVSGDFPFWNGANPAWNSGLRALNATTFIVVSTGDTLSTLQNIRDAGGFGGGSGEINTASNLGGGLANWDSKSGVDLRFNSFNAGHFNLASNLISLDTANVYPEIRATIPPGGSGTPGGSNTEIQFNNAGAFGGSSNLTWSGSQQVIKGASAGTAALDIFNGAYGSILLGADLNATTRTTATNKNGGIALYPYTNTEEPFMMIRGISTSTHNINAYGAGVNPGYNSVSQHTFYTAPNNTTLAGTLRFSLEHTVAYFNGVVLGIGTTSPDRFLHVEAADATTNSIVYPFRASHSTSGTNAIGSGVGYEWENENASGTMRVTSTAESVITDATNATEDADLVIKNIRAGTLTEGFRFTSTGNAEMSSGRLTVGDITAVGLDVQSNPDTLISTVGGVFGKYVIPTISAQADPDSLSSGEWYPTVTNNPAGYNSNVASSAHTKMEYQQVGSIVNVWGEIDVTATATSTNTAVAITLPIASDLTALTDITGAMCTWNITTGVNYQTFNGDVQGDATNNRAIITFNSHTATSLHHVKYSFSYQIK